MLTKSSQTDDCLKPSVYRCPCTVLLSSYRLNMRLCTVKVSSHLCMTVPMKNRLLITMGELIAELNVIKYYYIIELNVIKYYYIIELSSVNVLRNCDLRQQILHIHHHLERR